MRQTSSPLHCFRIFCSKACVPVLWLALALSLSSCGFVSSLWPFGSSKPAENASQTEQSASNTTAAAQPAQKDAESSALPGAKVKVASEQPKQASSQDQQAPKDQPPAPDAQKAPEQAQQQPSQGATPKTSETAANQSQPAPQAQEAKTAKEAPSNTSKKTANVQTPAAWKAENIKDASGQVPAATSRSMEGGPVTLVIKRGGPDCHRLSLNVFLPSKLSSMATDTQVYSVTMSVDEGKEINLVAKVDGLSAGLMTLKLLPRGNDAAELLSQMQDGKIVRLTTIFEAKALERHFSLEGFIEAMRASAGMCGPAKKP